MAPRKMAAEAERDGPPERWGPKAQKDGALRRTKVYRGPEAQPGGGGRGI